MFSQASLVLAVVSPISRSKQILDVPDLSAISVCHCRICRSCFHVTRERGDKLRFGQKLFEFLAGYHDTFDPKQGGRSIDLDERFYQHDGGFCRL